MPYKPGDVVRVVPIATDPYILQIRQAARVSHRVDAGYMLELDFVSEDLRLLGPIPAERLRPAGGSRG